MPRTRRVRQLEGMLALALITVFVVVASQRIIELRQAAEQVGVQSAIATMRDALGMRMATIVVQQGSAGLAALHLSNPVELLDLPPANYRGAFDGVPDPLPPGSWYFDRHRHELVYRVRYPQCFDSGDATAPERLRLQLRVEQRNGVVERISIEPLHPYHWHDASTGEC